MNLKDSLGLILFNKVINHLTLTLRPKLDIVIQRHIKKLSKLRNQKKLALHQNPTTFICQTFHNFFIILSHN